MEETTKVMKENKETSCRPSGGVKTIYLINPKDVVIENGVLVRMKRKYGKFTRQVHVIHNNNEKHKHKDL